MKELTQHYFQDYKKQLVYFIYCNKRFLLLTALIPLICFFLLIEWNAAFILFLFLAYLSAFIGYFLASTPLILDHPISINMKYQRMLTENVSDVVVVYEAESKKVGYVTPSVNNVLGYAVNELRKKRFLFIVHPDDRKIFSRNIRMALDHKEDKVSTPLRLLHKGGRFIWVDLHIQAVVNRKKNNQLVLSLRDISDLKEVESATQKFAEELARNKELAIAKTKEMDQLTQIMTTLEWREPIRIIRSYTQLLEQRFDQDLPNEGKEYLGFIKDNSNRMHEMIEGITQFYEVAKPLTEMQNVSTEQLLESISNELKTQIEATDARIVFRNLPIILGDPTQLRLLFKNLITNALKYQKPGRKPEIVIQAFRRNDHLVFSVNDNGIGIAPAYHHEVFELFRKLQHSDQLRGSGVGLSLCKKIAENHGGSIWVNSSGQDSGSTFYFKLQNGVKIA